MRHSIENHCLRLTVKEVGAELSSLVHLPSGREYIWQADPAIWGSHAPVLFPIIGVLKDGKTTIDGQEYRIPKHGMVRHNQNLEPYSHTEDRLTFRLNWDEKTLEQYPYEFDFRVTYRLREEHVIVYHEIRNEDDKTMYFCLGGHPAFRVPCFEGDRYEDYFLRFESPEDARSYLVLPDGTIGQDTREVPWRDGNILPLTHNLFAHDALVFKDLHSHSVILESARSGPVLKLDYAGWTHFGIWAKPEGDFVCLEPWMGLSDPADSDGQFKHKEGIISLEPGETYEMSFDIKILL
ncbi:aldose 1-epimerase family protein [Neolewinella lacunae]|uniref:Aldose 1-epimerase family protein n=1 Tax=Neolewinella lacunae TaxID=1517758 RepID=A0A923PS29_9BACT|nr:aldose 1-epimerase family protein [Neolewinella lacunae]MBC6995737.1 aldose 1-epimerase family protein [Neolewinella lacunae]MDN3636570.1 aldose 1-epimerase family protein [Neolewinella lacunae]